MKLLIVIKFTYLDGVEEPFMDQREGWSVDGTEFKVRMDAGVKALHWRGLYKNAGG
ncbi:phage major capsid protein [Chelatococcus reniformis]|uniref:phage major capsid protein n=1 Tax=Chelatococcus reniformis TaxID=1494448 RepID=UPI00402B2FC1